MRCRCCNKRLTKFYIKQVKTHCGSCARGVSAGCSYSDIVLGLAAEAKCHEYALRLERLAAKHRNDQLVGMETKRAERLKAVWASIRPMIKRLAYQGQRPTGEMVVRDMQQSVDDTAMREMRIRSDASIVEAFRERVAIMIVEGLSEFDATRAAYFELRRAGGNVPTAVNEEWKRVGRLTQ